MSVRDIFHEKFISLMNTPSFELGINVQIPLSSTSLPHSSIYFPIEYKNNFSIYNSTIP
ncbi:hypothetical protein K1T71_000658 [Dendrolimus kikuchii]|uniref:Uncharacterized protein n=1 Tax=Dendrolimus kikuchii TaxID=765133 RepID=A0ACC1DK20_9NEOP|nr:hypothetical protein K1T71_000658 [Dendrolimus kikuchii]